MLVFANNILDRSMLTVARAPLKVLTQGHLWV